MDILDSLNFTKFKVGKDDYPFVIERLKEEGIVWSSGTKLDEFIPRGIKKDDYIYLFIDFWGDGEGDGRYELSYLDKKNYQDYNSEPETEINIMEFLSLSDAEEIVCDIDVANMLEV